MKSQKAPFTKALAITLSLLLLFPAWFAQTLVACDVAYGAPGASATSSATSTSNSQVHGTIAPLNPEYVEYLESISATDTSLSAQDTTTQSTQTQSTALPSTLDLSYLSERYAEEAQNSYSTLSDDVTTLPESYDLRDYGLVGPVDYQGRYGTCWAFGMMGSIESSLITKQLSLADLSEKHLVWFSYMGDEEKECWYQIYGLSDNTNPYEFGGYNTTSLSTLAAWKGPISSEKLPYDDFDVEPSESLRYDADFHLQDCVYFYSSFIQGGRYPETSAPSNQIIKQLIMENGAYEIAYYAEEYGNKYCNDETFAIYHNEALAANHSNLIVGWDDNFSKENFSSECQPENNGAWLVRNTWGTNWGNDGYFWLSYEDKSIKLLGSSCTLEDTDNYANNYQYDTCGWIYSAAADDFIDESAASKTANISNIFTTTEDEQLEAVSFYTTDVGTEYEISVYINVTNGNPSSGNLVYSGQTGVEEYCGYHTIELDSAVALPQDTQYSVVVKLTNPSYAYPMALEGTIIYDNSDPKYLGCGGESYYSANGDEWTDVVDLGKYAVNVVGASYSGVYTTNVCLKAFTNPLPESSEAIGNVDFSLFAGEVALGSELELSGAENIHYTVTPLGGKEGEVRTYTGAITIDEPCTITAWGEKNGKQGNKVSKTFTQQLSRLTDLSLKDVENGTITHPDINSTAVVRNNSTGATTNVDIVLTSTGNKISLCPCGKDEITVNGTAVKSDEWSGKIPLEVGKTTTVTIKTAGDGKEPLSYTLNILLSPITYDYISETLSFDSSLYSVADEQGKVLQSGDSVSPYITINEDETKSLTVTNNQTGSVQTITVPTRPDFETLGIYIGINYQSECTSSAISSRNLVSYNADMSDAVRGNYQPFPIKPGETIYIQRAATTTSFAGTVYKITAPERPQAPEPEITEVGADYCVFKEIEGGEYRLLPDGEWQIENYLFDLKPNSEYEFEVRMASSGNSFVSPAKSIKAKTLDGAPVKIIYKAYGYTISESNEFLPEGESVYEPAYDLSDYGYTASKEDIEQGRKVVVARVGENLVATPEEIVFEITASINPSDYTYKVNYWKEDGTMLSSSTFSFTHTEELDISEIAVPDGYKAEGLIDDLEVSPTALTYYQGKWVVDSPEVNLKVSKLPEPEPTPDPEPVPAPEPGSGDDPDTTDVKVVDSTTSGDFANNAIPHTGDCYIFVLYAASGLALMSALMTFVVLWHRRRAAHESNQPKPNL